MQSLRLMLKVFIAASLLVQPIESLANTSKVHHSKKTSKKNTLHDAGNVWERIRFGMQIPIFSPQSTSLPPNPLKSQKNALIKTTLLLDANRTKLGNSKTTTKHRLSASLIQKQIVDYANNGSPESATVHTRIRTRLEFHPKVNNDAKVATETTPAIIKTTAILTTEAEQKSAQALLEKNSVVVQRVDKRAEINERINRQISWYSQRRGYLQQVAERARPYLYHIVSGLSGNHLPAELALLPIVESSYQPTAQSPKSAAGLWQFIPSTGLDFDLAQNDRYDGRLDIDTSTQAAVRYLGFLKRHFNGDWLLALAAYNCGLGRVDDAISSNRANGLATDYWSLNLPQETQDYVPRFLALANIFANPNTYGLKLPAVKNEPYFVKVKVNRQFDIDYLSKKHLTTIAELANLSYEQFVQLNPGYLKQTLETDQPFTLLLPETNANYLHQHLSHVERFLAGPTISVTNAPLQQRARVDDAQKNLPIAIVAALPNKQPTFTSPLLSLNFNANQTTPRINDQSVFIKS